VVRPCKPGEKLDRIHRKVRDVSDDVDKANWMLNGMASVKGWMWNSWFSKPPERRSEKPSTAAADSKTGASAPTAPARTSKATPVALPRSSSSSSSSSSTVAGSVVGAGRGLDAGKGSSAFAPSPSSGKPSSSTASSQTGARSSEAGGEMDDLLDGMSEDLAR
jgi:hypothetical protein